MKPDTNLTLEEIQRVRKESKAGRPGRKEKRADG